jgi:ribose transport system ATP-binding protein
MSGQALLAMDGREPLLRATGLVLARNRAPIEEAFRPGEIVGLAGLEGQGQERFISVLAGLARPEAGEVLLTEASGRTLRITSHAQAARNRIVYLPRDRRTTGVFPGLSVLDNFGLPSMPAFSRFGILRRGEQRRRVREYRDYLSIVFGSMDAPISSLSGGNQQKVLLARWLALDPKVMLLNDPTRGVDLGTRLKLYEIFRDLANSRGIALVVLSTEIEEVLQLCDRVLVFRDMEVFTSLERHVMSIDSVLAAMFGQTAAAAAAVGQTFS